MAAVIGYRCEGFAEATRELFVEKRGDYFLSDRHASTAVSYGPEIPFCGNALGATSPLQRAIARK